MLPILVLALWMTSGLVAAVALARPDERPTSWIPFGLILGPLWVPVVMERRTDGRR